jgi:hypothetical protein
MFNFHNRILANGIQSVKLNELQNRNNNYRK